PTEAAPFDLTVGLVETPDGIVGSAEYARDLFDGVTLRRLLDRWQALLAGLAETPERPLSTTEALRPAERHQLLAEWNDALWDQASAADLTAHELFLAQAARTPEAPALFWAG